MMNAPEKQPSAGVDSIIRHFEMPLYQPRRFRYPRLWLYLIAAITFALLLWVAIAKVDQVVRTAGRIVPTVKPQLIQHLEGGIVTKVFVHEGDLVKAGQPLLSVSATQANSSRGEKVARVDGLKAKAARLEAEAAGNSQFVPPAGTNPLSPEVMNEQDSFRARQQKLTESVRVMQQQAAQKRQEMNEQQTKRNGISRELELAKQQLALVSSMMSKNAASQQELLEARTKVERLNTEMSETAAAIPRLAAAEQEQLARIAEVVAQFRSDARTALADTRVELERLDQELHAENDRVKRTLVTAPLSGTVNKMQTNTVGGVVKPGEVLLEITPNHSVLEVETRATPADRGVLRVGQRAVIRVAAFDYTVFGTLPATVTEISPDSILDEKGERFFRVSARVNPADYQRFGQPISPGMTISADVVTGERTILQYLLSPIRGMASTAFRDRK